MAVLADGMRCNRLTPSQHRLDILRDNPLQQIAHPELRGGVIVHDFSESGFGLVLRCRHRDHTRPVTPMTTNMGGELGRSKAGSISAQHFIANSARAATGASEPSRHSLVLGNRMLSNKARGGTHQLSFCAA